VDGRGKAPVRLELRKFEPTEVEERGLEFVRSRLILNFDEDPWHILRRNTSLSLSLSVRRNTSLGFGETPSRAH
jgi:hypothetical protein